MLKKIDAVNIAKKYYNHSQREKIKKHHFVCNNPSQIHPIQNLSFERPAKSLAPDFEN